MTERFIAYRLSPYPWEVQFAATEPRSLLAPFYSSDDENAVLFACSLWASWFGEAAFLWDNLEKRWVTSRAGSPGSSAIRPLRTA